MSETTRRKFLAKAALGAGIAAAPRPQAVAQDSANNRINLAIVGIHGRGQTHIEQFGKIPGVRIAYLCDIDERLFPESVAKIEGKHGYKPKTHHDLRKVLEDPQVDAITVATPDHWHALHTIWACQAGKDVYCEKPCSYTIVEGRRMVEAARKYDRLVQVGLNRRSSPKTRAAMEFVRSGQFGSVYRSKTAIYKGRASVGRERETSIPQGVHWDLFLGPAKYRAFSPSRFHYGWHFFWDTSTTDIGNTGVHSLDVLRWGAGQQAHPVKIQSYGGVYVWDSDQETPNVQNAGFEYADGTIMEVELTNLYSPPFDGERSSVDVLYTDQGYVSSSGGWKAMRGKFTPRDKTSDVGVDETAANASFPSREYSDGPEIVAPDGDRGEHFVNFIEALRSRNREHLHCEIEEGHLSTALAHLANISYRTGRKLIFDPDTETFPGDDEANGYLTREYREPYTLPDLV